MQNFNIPIWLEECHGLRRLNEPVRLGVPLSRGLLSEGQKIRVVSHVGQSILNQARPLCLWPDRSIKWLLLDIFATLQAHECAAFAVVPRIDEDEAFITDSPTSLAWQESPEAFAVDTGAALFRIPKKAFAPFASIKLGAVEILSGHASWTRLLDKNGNEYISSVERWRMEENGPLRATLLAEGHFVARSLKPALSFIARLAFFVNSSAVRVELQVRNPQAALHPGGLWDLGDPGSFFFKDLSIQLQPTGSVQQLDWYAETPNQVRSIDPDEWTLYQDSSGGENWNSRNHIDCSGNLSVSFHGYRIDKRKNGQSERLGAGKRATPGIRLRTESGWVAATVQDYWQNFPKALRWQDGALSIGLFPRESQSGFELQGGEQKRHTVWLDFGLPEQETVLARLQHPVQAWVDPIWVEETKTVSYFVANQNDPNSEYLHYIENIVEGPNSFLNKREVIDEYGWRNFGDLYADHEAVNHRGSSSLISHYNNQYDFIYGALIHFLRTGDSRWHQLLNEAARHTIDIDIYHTDQDKSAYNHGLFWHTDHYKDAQTCTHRTYSRKNSGKDGYGGGPSNEHNYTSGLLHYYYLTGDPEAAHAVLELASWVVSMDDGARTLLGSLDDGPTGGASQTVSTLYHKPGRGSGNSISVLLDAYRLTNDHHFLTKAEALIQRCIHPKDDIAALKLDEPEYRWSYLVFLQVLGKYLDTKIEWGETDYSFYYARDSLLHYADWMLDNEVPYKDVLHKVELPTETWPAHDIRKCHIFHLAAKYGHFVQRARFTQKADVYFQRCLTDLLSFETAYLTRPLVILSVYGYVHAYFNTHYSENPDFYAHGYDFGNPTVFLPQKARVKATLKRKLRVVAGELKRLSSDKGYQLKSKLFKKQ
ncbi:MAG: hypothetical protein IPL51_08865 [Candidatus Competibacteraceae bacterium]|nr:hypothetical protein [Candidatus Competibacteraceae bacterium]